MAAAAPAPPGFAGEAVEPHAAGATVEPAPVVRIMLATAVPALGAGLERWLDGARAGWEVAGVVHDGAALQRALQDEHQDVLVAEERLRGCMTLEVVRAQRVAPPTLMLVTEPTPAREAAFLRAGASGVVALGASRAGLVQALVALVAGRSVLSVAAARLLARGRARGGGPELTARQRQILGLLAQGMSTNDIAGELFLTESTIKTHISRISARVGVSGVRGLAREASLLLAS